MTEQTFQIHFLADFPDESYVIARWYFEEWAYTIPGVTPAQVHEKSCLRLTADTNFHSHLLFMMKTTSLSRPQNLRSERTLTFQNTNIG